MQFYSLSRIFCVLITLSTEYAPKLKIDYSSYGLSSVDIYYYSFIINIGTTKKGMSICRIVKFCFRNKLLVIRQTVKYSEKYMNYFILKTVYKENLKITIP